MHVPSTAVWGLETLASNYKEPRNSVRRYFNHCMFGTADCQLVQFGCSDVTGLEMQLDDRFYESNVIEPISCWV